MSKCLHNEGRINRTAFPVHNRAESSPASEQKGNPTPMSFSTATAVPYGARIGGQTMLRGATLGAMAQSVGIIIAAATVAAVYHLVQEETRIAINNLRARSRYRRARHESLLLGTLGSTLPVLIQDRLQDGKPRKKSMSGKLSGDRRHLFACPSDQPSTSNHSTNSKNTPLGLHFGFPVFWNASRMSMPSWAVLWAFRCGPVAAFGISVMPIEPAERASTGQGPEHDILARLDRAFSPALAGDVERDDGIVRHHAERDTGLDSGSATSATPGAPRDRNDQRKWWLPLAEEPAPPKLLRVGRRSSGLRQRTHPGPSR